jgi:hypothetical protein
MLQKMQRVDSLSDQRRMLSRNGESPRFDRKIDTRSREVGPRQHAQGRTPDRDDAEAEDWFNGAPYAVAESVFDGDSQEGCTLAPED